MFTNLIKKLMPMPMTGRIYSLVLLAIFIPSLIISVSLSFQYVYVEKSRKEKEIYAVASLMEKRLQGSYLAAWQEQLASSQPADIKAKNLNAVLQPLVEQFSAAYPSLGLGFYSLELDSMVAASPDLASSLQASMERDYPYLQSSETGQPEYFSNNTSKGWWDKPIVNLTYPIKADGRIIGHAWVNFKTDDIYTAAVEATGLLALGVGLFICLGMIIFSRFFFKEMQTHLLDFAAAAATETPKQPESVIPDLQPILEELRQQIDRRIKAEQDLNHLFDMSLDLLFITDMVGNIKRVNPAFEKMIGQNEKQLLGKSIKEFMHPDDYVRSTISRVGLITGSTMVNLETRVVDADGLYRWLSWTSVPVMEEGLVYSVARDITDRKKMEEELRLSQENLLTTFNTSPAPIMICNLDDWQFLMVNDSFLQITGWQREEVIGRTMKELNLFNSMPGEDNDKQLIIDEKISRYVVRNLETKVQTKTGDKRIWLLSTEIINQKGRDCLLGLGVDITEHKQFEVEMARLDQLNLVGQLAAGISHELRNPMTTVRGFLQMLGSKEKLIEYKDYFELMQSELDRANSIISEFLSLSRNKQTKFNMINLNQVIYTLAPLLESDALLFNCQIKYELGFIPDILADQKQIHQLILNMSRNGLEAMSPGGCLTIKTFQDNGRVMLAIQDQGRGIDQEILQVIGTPFFTTKENGTGLGLATCYSIVSRHNAKVDIDTGPGGTTFIISFSLQ